MENRAEHLLESYFANGLSSSEADELKTMIANDPAVASEFAFQKQLSYGLRSEKLIGGIQNPAWKAAAQSPASSAIKVSILPRFYYAAAATIVLLVAAYIFFQPPSLQTIVADNTAVYLNNMKFKSLGEEAQAVPEAVIKAFQLYDQNAYPEAAKALEQIVLSNSERMDYRFFWGVALVQSRQYESAKTALITVAQSPDEKRIPALFYLGLAYAGTGDKQAALENLQAYIDSLEGVSFRKQAEAVKKAL